MGKLSDILKTGGSEDLHRAWDETEAAQDYTPLPSGEYVARLIAGELCNSRTNGTPGYKLTFKVLEGEYAGRLFWHDIWLTSSAMPMAKRDLRKLGVTDLKQLEQPLPPGFRCSVKLTLRREDDGSEYNRVRRFQVLGIDEPEHDPFAVPDTTNDADSTAEAGTSRESIGDAGADSSTDSSDETF